MALFFGGEGVVSAWRRGWFIDFIGFCCLARGFFRQSELSFARGEQGLRHRLFKVLLYIFLDDNF